MAAEPKTARYDVREDGEGWSVFDVFTGEVAVIALVPQTGLDIQDADDAADLLNRMAERGDRSIRQ
jgi:hypothetical protein